MTKDRLLLLLILLVAAGLRLYGLQSLSPPGLAHDEVANWLIGRSILDEGNHAVYYTAAYGHEAGFHYLQAAAIGLLGDHALALRLPAAFAGLLALAVSYLLARQLFGRRVALYSVAWLAVLFWPIFYSRLALRAILLPLLSGLSAYFWWRGWELPGGRRGRRYLALAGVLAGLSLYSYMAARAVPIFYALFFGYLALWHREALLQRWRGLLLFVLLFTAVSLPLVSYLLSNPGAELRISEIDAPLRALRSGDLGPVLQNGWRILAGFGWAGDPLWRQNVALQPVFEPVGALLFYMGLLWALWRWRDARYAFLLLWAGTAVLPSLATINAPSTIRMINLLPILTILAVELIHNLSQLSTVFNRLSTLFWQNSLAVLGFLAYLAISIQSIYIIWPNGGDVPFVWQQSLAEAAVYLDESEDSSPVAIGGWTPDTMDAPTMALSLRRDDLALSFFQPEQMLLLPMTTDNKPLRILQPTALLLVPLFQEKLATWGATQTSYKSITLHRLPTNPQLAPQIALDVPFNGEMRLLGYDRLPGSGDADTIFDLVTYWQVDVAADAPRRVFVQAIDAAGALVAQHEGLDMADTRWQPHRQDGDRLLLYHATAVPTETAVALRIGIYNPLSCPPAPCENLLLADGSPFLTVPLD